jgi:hypothetical protein
VARDRFAERPLGKILPEEEDAPLDVVTGLWAETGGLDEDQSEELVQRLHALSLLQRLNLRARTLRLHDNMIWYLRDTERRVRLSSFHGEGFPSLKS